MALVNPAAPLRIGDVAAAVTGSRAPVSMASLDFESGSAVVRYDGPAGMEEAAIATAKKAGFGAEVRR